MTNEHLLDAIGLLDDDLVAEAAAPVRRRIPLGAITGLAAALVLCVGLLSIPQLRQSLPKNAGTAAAPESADNAAAEDMYQYTADQEMQLTADSVNRSEETKNKENLPHASVTAGSGAGAASDVAKPVFHTSRGVYRIVMLPTDASPTLPADAVSLGTLQRYPCDDAALPTVNDEAMVGHPVWESGDGTHLYIQTPSGWYIAKRSS